MINTHHIKMSFGKHEGELITRVPRHYLTWMCNEPSMDKEWRDMAKAELDRRGTVMPTIELSGHSIDRASLRCRRTWHETKNDDEGIYSWLMRMAVEAREKGTVVTDRKGAYRHLGIRWVFAEGEEFPVLKSVMPMKGKKASK